ncbi:transaldolase [Blastopirellula sp. JC732]|uniref:Transaldolase n=1 Tax=Blastopirellula sediminis TaxID=2894196 RepID=A0A9X1MM02_9BACT|nr:transaldolase family protein [Blastopirellula sediminis]MCC9607421.1 transaldolase [Blastopirellula sediminis]MCC9629286.1 transaldolase [Blastopirellula sediminis]
MASPLESLIASGTKLWLDSIDPDLVRSNFALGATGATSNPVIVSDLIKTGRFDDKIAELIEQGLSDNDVAWTLTNQLVSDAQSVFLPVWEEAEGNNGYVSFEVDPLLEDPEVDMPHDERVAKYIELGKHWAQGQKNRMIKVPATPAGLDAVEELCAAGVTLNVTLIFTERQYEAARDAVWRGAQRRANLDGFKSVYSIFVSRVDVYTEEHLPQLTAAAQGQLGIVNAKRIWQMNQKFWSDKPVKQQQEMIFASTGTKKPEDPPWKYVAAFAGSDIETNPPGTNDKVQASGVTITRQVDEMPSDAVLADLDKHVDYQHLEKTLMEEGIAKFANPQKGLLKLIAEKRAEITVG